MPANLKCPEGKQNVTVSTNLDTSMIKLVAAILMLINHIQVVFFPDLFWVYAATRCIFPLFCYCMVIGMMYTHDIGRYLLRVAGLALISQPLTFILRPGWTLGDPIIWNEVFTLAASLAGVYGIKSKQWWLYPFAMIVIVWFELPYSILGILCMTVFYLCRNKRFVGMLAYVLVIGLFSISPTDQAPFAIGAIGLNEYVFALLAVPLIFIPTKTGVRLPRWFFYAFYPGHLAVLMILHILFTV